jgi:hypothetical protein
MGTVVIYDAGTGETIEREETPDEIAIREALGAEAAEQEASRPFVLPKMLLWTRLTDAEAEAVETAMSSQSARLRGIWNSATEVRSDSEFFGILQTFLTAVLSAGRASELLHPE